VIVDSSALVAVVMSEPRGEDLFKMLVRAPVVGAGAPSLLEASMVLDGRLGAADRESASRLALLVARVEMEVLPFREDHWPVAWAAFLRYGKGRHPAGLNFGDCLAYAIAKLSARPLLCLGGDFSQTDLELVPLPD
jgi:ribonuclease VapC